jgi:hypothetical protein
MVMGANSDYTIGDYDDSDNNDNNASTTVLEHGQ